MTYMIPYKQLSLIDIFTNFQNKFDNDKYEFLSILDNIFEPMYTLFVFLSRYAL